MSRHLRVAALLVLFFAVPVRAEPIAVLVAGATQLVSAERARHESLAAGEPVCELAGADRARTSSVVCLSCHDGTTTAAATHRGVVGASSHPVEISYEAARLRRPAALHPGARLPFSLVLPAGKVTCTTCHDGASREPNHVAASMDGSAMCLGCHSL